MASYKYTFKILLLGDGAVGKTSLVQRFIHNKFQSGYLMTIGMEPYSRFETIKDTRICLQLWDIAGQDRFASMRRIFFKGSLGALVTYDITRRQSFENLKTWIKEAQNESPRIMLMLVGNKNDLEDLRDVSTEEGKKFAEESGCIGFIETSAKSGTNVAEAFLAMGEEILNSVESMD
ncbi:MAG: Rab family GTPase [Candidatus Heimdallarchaeaceae archaeon]